LRAVGRSSSAELEQGLTSGEVGSSEPHASLLRELWIAQAVVDVATRHARGRTVQAIELRLGRDRAVRPQTLDFAFALLTEGTPLDGAELEIEQVAGGDLAVSALRMHDTRNR
jgi:hypothetical protein